MKIAILGLGHVGSSVKRFIEEYYEVVTFDPKHDSIYPHAQIDRCEVSIVCVPTPMLPSGECDTSIVDSVVSQLGTPYVLIKSTVPPGTTDRLRKATGKRICFSPEYIGQSMYNNPVYRTMNDVPFLIVGGPKSERNHLFSILEPIVGPYVQLFGCTAMEAEIIKYMENAFLATKVTFVNEFYEIAKAFGTNWYRIREGWLLDERVGRGFSSIFLDQRGFAGKCLPKDVNAIIYAAQKTGYSADLLREVLNSNDRFNKMNDEDAKS